MVLQWALFKLIAHSEFLERHARGKAALVFYEGHFVDKKVHEEAVTVDDIRAAIRANGIADLEDVGAVVFEADGKLNVVKRAEDGAYPVLQGMKDDTSSRMKTARSAGSRASKEHILSGRAQARQEVGE